MNKLFIAIFSLFFLIVSTQRVHANDFWNEVSNYLYDSNYNYYDNYDYYNGYDYYNNYNYYDNNYDYGYDYGYTSSCPYMSYYNYYSQICECYDGYLWYDYQCISQSQYCQRYLGANSRYDRWTNSCICQNGYEVEGQSCVYRGGGYYQHNDNRQPPNNNTNTGSDTRTMPTTIPSMNRTAPAMPPPPENRPLPTAIPPMDRTPPALPIPLNIRVPTTRPWPTITPRPIPTWLLEYNSSKITPTPQNTVCIDQNDGKKCVNINIGSDSTKEVTPTLIPAKRPGQGSSLVQSDTDTQPNGFWQWVSSFGKK